MSRVTVRRLLTGSGMLILALASFISLTVIKNSFASQTAAKRWQSGDVRYTQLSCFIDSDEGCTPDKIESLVSGIDKKMTGESLDLSWTYCFSGETTLTVERGDQSVTARAICTGGDFFHFHPQSMIGGWYYNADSRSGDGVMIDMQLAWKLFGGYNLEGMSVNIGNHQCPITGVVYSPENSLENKLYETTPTIYVPYSLLLTIDRTADVTCFEAVLPNPVKNFGMGMLESTVSFSEQNYEILENTDRMGFIPGITMLADFGTRTQKTSGVYYPFWENAARAGESWNSLLAVLTALFAIYPIILCIIYIAKLIGFIKLAIIKKKNKIFG